MAVEKKVNRGERRKQKNTNRQAAQNGGSKGKQETPKPKVTTAAGVDKASVTPQVPTQSTDSSNENDLFKKQLAIIDVNALVAAENAEDDYSMFSPQGLNNLDGKINKFIKDKLSFLDNIGNNLAGSALGGLFVPKSKGGGASGEEDISGWGNDDGDGDGSISGSIANMITNSVNFDAQGIINTLDEQLIQKHLPMVGGILPGMMSKYMYVPDTSVDALNSQRVNQFMAQRTVSGVAAYSSGMALTTPTNMFFSTNGCNPRNANLGGLMTYGGYTTPASSLSGAGLMGSYNPNSSNTLLNPDNTLNMGTFMNMNTTEQTMMMVFSGQSNSLGRTSGAPTNDILASNSSYMDVFCAGLADNYRMKSETFSNVMDIYTDLDPYWDIENRHELAYNLSNQAIDYIDDIKEQTYNIIDGAGDYIKETWENFGTSVRDTVNNTYDQINNIAGNFGVMLNPELKAKLDGWLDKCGFPTEKGQGYDWEGFPSRCILHSSVIHISPPIGEALEIPMDSLEDYYEEHDYMDKEHPLRKIKLRIPAAYKRKGNTKTPMTASEVASATPEEGEEISPVSLQYIDTNIKEGDAIDTKSGALKITLKRNYAFTRSQNFDIFSFNGNAVFRMAEVLHEFIAIPDKTAYVKDSAGALKQYEKLGDIKQVATDEVVTFTLLSIRDSKLNNPIKYFEGIPTENKTTMTGLFQKAFMDHYYGDEEGRKNDSNSSQMPANAEIQLALAPPAIEELPNTIYTKMNFKDMIYHSQNQFGNQLYPGGVNVFQDDKVVYVFNKKGPNKIEFEGDWKYTFRVLREGTAIDSVYTLMSVSEQSVIQGLFNSDIMKAADFEAQQQELTVSNTTSTQLTVNTNVNSTVHNVVVEDTPIAKVQSDVVDLEETTEYIIRVPNTFMIFRPGDDIKLEFPFSDDPKSMSYVGTVKKWASQANKDVRTVILWVTLKKGNTFPGENPDIANNPVTKAINDIQQKTSTWADKAAAQFDRVTDRIRGMQDSWDKSPSYQADKAAKESYDAPVVQKQSDRRSTSNNNNGLISVWSDHWAVGYNNEFNNGIINSLDTVVSHMGEFDAKVLREAM